MVKFNDLDLGYDQCKDLYDTIKTEGERLLSDLNLVYKGLNNHWKGEDATLHINQIVDVYNGVNEFIKDTGNAISFATKKVIEVQNIRKANGSSSVVGSELGTMLEKESLSKIETTAEYSCVPEAKKDLQTLIQVCDEFNIFSNNVETKTEELLENWQDGNERNIVMNNSQDFEKVSTDYMQFLNETRDALEIAVENLSQIM